jgi:hypothetical protein
MEDYTTKSNRKELARQVSRALLRDEQRLLDGTHRWVRTINGMRLVNIKTV